MPGRGTPPRLLGELGLRLQRTGVCGTLVLGEERDFAVFFGAGGVRAAHRALPFEDHTFVDDDARRGDVAEHLAGRADLETLARRDVPGHLAVHHDRGTVDLRVDDRALADRERILCGDFPLDVPLDPHRTLEHELAGDPASLAEERARPTRLLDLGLVTVAVEHLHLPWRRLVRRYHRLGP